MNYKDIELLNNSMRYAGQAFDTTRQQGIENALRTRGMDIAQERNKIADKHYQEESDYNKERNRIADERAQAGAANADQRAQQKEDNDFLTQIFKANSEGQITDYDAVNKALREHPRLGATGIQIGPPAARHGAFQTAETRNTEYESTLQDAIDQATDPAAKAKLQSKLDLFRANKSARRPGEDEATVTEHTPAVEGSPAVPEVPGSKGFFGIGATKAVPAIPAVPSQPARSISYKAKIDPKTGKPVVPSAAPGTNAPPELPPMPLDKATAAKILQEAGGDVNKARLLARQRGYTF